MSRPKSCTYKTATAPEEKTAIWNDCLDTVTITYLSLVESVPFLQSQVCTTEVCSHSPQFTEFLLIQKKSRKVDKICKQTVLPKSMQSMLSCHAEHGTHQHCSNTFHIWDTHPAAICQPWLQYGTKIRVIFR